MPFTRSFSVVTGVAVAAAALSAEEGRQRPGASGGPTRLIVRALANGQPVADLKAEELTVRIDGRPRQVTSLELVSAAASAAGGGAAAEAKPAPTASLPPPFATNVSHAPAASAAGGREFVIILDEEGVGPGQEEPVKRAIAKLMSEAGEGDRFGFVSLRVGGHQIPPSAGRSAITEEMAKFVGGGLTTETIVDITCRTKRSMGALVSAMQQAPAGRTLVLITSGLVANPAPPQQIRSRVNARTGDIDDTIPETCQIRSTDLEDFGIAASMSPANMYIVHYPQAMAAQAHLQAGQTGIENLAGVSNAEFVRLTGGNEASLSRIVRETSSYYLVTLDEGAAGPIRRIDARASREGVKVLARPAAGRGRPAGPATAKGMSPRDMIKTTAAFSEVPLRAAGFLSRQGTSEMKLVTLFEPTEPGTKLTAASVAVIDEKGNARQWNAKDEDLARSPAVSSQLITPGKYRVRVAATTASGGGTVDFPIEAALADAGSLKMSMMLIGVMTDKGFMPTLQFTPADKFAIGVVEVYGVPKGANVTAQYELTTGPADPPIGADAGRISNGPTEDSRAILGGFGIETLQPGDYLLRVKVSLDGKEVGTATRTIRKVTGS